MLLHILYLAISTSTIINTAQGGAGADAETSPPLPAPALGKHSRDGSPSVSNDTGRGRRWCFTIFRTDDGRPLVVEADALGHLRGDASIEMYQFQYEVCPGTHGAGNDPEHPGGSSSSNAPVPPARRLHIQGYIRYKNAVGLARVKKDLRSQSAHCELCKGNEEDNLEYTSKEESRVPDTVPFRYGEPMPGNAAKGHPGRGGNRTDIQRLCDFIKEGHNYHDVALQMPEMIIKYSKGVRDLLAEYVKPREGDLEVRCYIGQARCGKTWDAVHELSSKFDGDEDKWYCKTANNKWFDGYYQQPGTFS